MGLLAWVIMGLAVWHFTIWLPDRFWGGIVGAFIGSIYRSDPGRAHHPRLLDPRYSGHPHVITAIEGIPGSLIGMALIWVIGVRQEQRAAAAAPATR